MNEFPLYKNYTLMFALLCPPACKPEACMQRQKLWDSLDDREKVDKSDTNKIVLLQN